MTSNGQNNVSDPRQIKHHLPADRGLHGPRLRRQQGVKPSGQVIGLLLAPLRPSRHTSSAPPTPPQLLHTQGLGFSQWPAGHWLNPGSSLVPSPGSLLYSQVSLSARNHPWLQPSELSPRLSLAAVSYISCPCMVTANMPISFPKSESDLLEDRKGPSCLPWWC